MSNSADLGGCYPPRPLALVDNTLLNLQNSSYPTQPPSIIANIIVYFPTCNDMSKVSFQHNFPETEYKGHKLGLMTQGLNYYFYQHTCMVHNPF